MSSKQRSMMFSQKSKQRPYDAQIKEQQVYLIPSSPIEHLPQIIEIDSNSPVPDRVQDMTQLNLRTNEDIKIGMRQVGTKREQKDAWIKNQKDRKRPLNVGNWNMDQSQFRGRNEDRQKIEGHNIKPKMQIIQIQDNGLFPSIDSLQVLDINRALQLKEKYKDLLTNLQAYRIQKSQLDSDVQLLNLKLSLRNKIRRPQIIQVESESEKDCMMIEPGPRRQSSILVQIIESTPQQQIVRIVPHRLNISLLNKRSQVLLSNLISEEQRRIQPHSFRPQQVSILPLPSEQTKQPLFSTLNINEYFQYEFGQQVPQIMFRVKEPQTQLLFNIHFDSKIRREKIGNIFNKIKKNKRKLMKMSNKQGFKMNKKMSKLSGEKKKWDWGQKDTICLSSNAEFKGLNFNVEIVPGLKNQKYQRKFKNQRRREPIPKDIIFNLGRQTMQRVLQLKKTREISPLSVKSEMITESTSPSEQPQLQPYIPPISDINLVFNFPIIQPQTFLPVHLFKRKFFNKYNNMTNPTTIQLQSKYFSRVEMKNRLMRECRRQVSVMRQVLERVNRGLAKDKRVDEQEGEYWFRRLEQQGKVVMEPRRRKGKGEFCIRKVTSQ